MTDRFERMRQAWYRNTSVQFELIKTLMYKETVFLRSGCVHRCIKTNAVHYLLKNWDRYHFMTEPFNLYSSLAHYPNMPVFSFNKDKKRREMDDFNEDFLSLMKGYDLLLDIDNPNLELCYSTTHRIKQELDARKIPYWMIFSGTKGFHFRIDYADMPESLKEMKFTDLSMLFKKFAENFKLKNKYQDLDLSVFDLRRIAKTPYSVVYPNYLIALPLSDEMFANFSLKEVSLPYWLNRTEEVFKRGLFKRKGTPEAIGKLIEKYTK